MKTSEELVYLSNAIGKAICAYHNAVTENLRESGKEFTVSSDTDDEGERLEVLNCDGGSDNMVIDKVRWNPDYACGIGCVECHCCEFNYGEYDEWFDISNLGDAGDYVLNNIEWDD